MEHRTHPRALGVAMLLAALPALAHGQGLTTMLETSLAGTSPELVEAWLTKLVCLLTGIFIAGLGRSQFDLRARLDSLDHLLWLAILLSGAAIGGVIAAFGLRHESGMLVGLISLLMAISLTAAAIRCRTRLPSTRRRFMLAAVAALAGPAWVGVEAHGGALPITAVALVTTVAALSMLMLSVPLPRFTAGAHELSPTDGDAMLSPHSVQMTFEHASGVDQSSHAVDTSPSRSGRRQLHQRLIEGINRTRRSNAQLALIWVKLEGLEEARRMLGDDIARELVNGVGRRLNRTVGGGMLVCRYSTSNFAMVFEAVSGMEEVVAWIEDIRATLASPVDLGDGAIAIDTGVGHALYPQDGVDPSSLYRTAARRAARTTRAEQRLRSAA